MYSRCKKDLERLWSGVPLLWRSDPLLSPALPSGGSTLQLAQVVRGYRAVYMGHVPTEYPTDQAETEMCVERILDVCNIREGNTHGVFLRLQPYALHMHFVDSMDKVMHTKCFDLARISYCSGGNFGDSRLLAWNYKQETEEGFQMECHAVKLVNGRRARALAMLLGRAFTTMDQQLQAAGQSWQLLRSAASHTGHKNDSEDNSSMVFIEDDYSWGDEQDLIPVPR